RGETELEFQQPLRRHDVNLVDIGNRIGESGIDDIVISAKACLYPNGICRDGGETEQQREEREDKPDAGNQTKNQSDWFNRKTFGNHRPCHRRPLLTQTCCRAQAFNSRTQPRNDGFLLARRSLGGGGSHPVLIGRCRNGHSLTRCPCTRKLEDDYEKHDLVSTCQSWHVRVDGSNANTTRSRQTCAGFQSHHWRRLAGKPERLSRQMGGALFLSERFHTWLYDGSAEFPALPRQL